MRSSNSATTSPTSCGEAPTTGVEHVSIMSNEADDLGESELFSDADLSAAILAFIGYGLRRTPGANDAAVLALKPVGGAQLVELVKRTLRASDTVNLPTETFENGSLSDPFAREFEKICPGLSQQALRALAWRWAYFEYF